MAIAKNRLILAFAGLLLCLGTAAPAARAASATASAQIIIIMPEREPAETPATPASELINPWPDILAVPGTSLREEPGTVRSGTVRSTTVIQDGDSIRMLHTEFSPL